MVASGSGGGAAVRQLGLFTVLCIGVNNIVGSGIYRKPSELARLLGGASWIAFAIDGLLLVTVALCFAAMATRHDEAGGPYLYARRAFGRWTGFVVAWTAWISMWAALAAAVTGIPGYLAVFLPGIDAEPASSLVAVVLVVLLAIVNCVGVRSAAGTATFLTVAKLLPLLLFVGFGLFAVDWSRLAWWPVTQSGAALPEGPATPAAALGLALFAAFYPLQGFEVVPVPAGELKNARRDVPLAVTLSLVASAAFYCLIQIVAVGTAPDLATASADGSDRVRPLATAAATFLGPAGVKMIAAGACVSMFGFAAVTMFCAPRFLVALGSDGLLPKKFARHHPTRATPVTAVVVTAVAALLGTLFPLIAAAHHRLIPDATPMDGAATFERLTALSNLAVLVQYATTCLAVITLAAHRPDGGLGFRLPGGRWPIPLLGLGACAFLGYLITQDQTWLEQVVLFVAWVALGVLLAAWTRRELTTKDGGRGTPTSAPPARASARRGALRP